MPFDDNLESLSTYIAPSFFVTYTATELQAKLIEDNIVKYSETAVDEDCNKPIAVERVVAINPFIPPSENRFVLAAIAFTK